MRKERGKKIPKKRKMKWFEMSDETFQRIVGALLWN